MLKFPSISKKVRWRVVVPTWSMSGVRKHFWQLVSRWCGGFSRPWKYGLSGCMPAVVSSTDGSCSAGTGKATGSRLWSRLSKKLRKRSRISSEVIAPESRLRAHARRLEPDRLREPLDAGARGPRRGERTVRVDREAAGSVDRADRRRPGVARRTVPAPGRRAVLGVPAGRGGRHVRGAGAAGAGGGDGVARGA